MIANQHYKLLQLSWEEIAIHYLLMDYLIYKKKLIFSILKAFRLIMNLPIAQEENLLKCLFFLKIKLIKFIL